MGRILKNAIKELGENDIFYLGSKTNFFFIGTKAEWERDQEEVEQWCHEFTDNEVINARENWERTIFAGLPDRSKYATYEKWAEDCEATISKLGRAQKRMIMARRAAKAYRPVINRAVVEGYDRTVPGEPGKIFIVSGTEVGRYWSRDEYINKTGVDDILEDEEEIGETTDVAM